MHLSLNRFELDAKTSVALPSGLCLAFVLDGELEINAEPHKLGEAKLGERLQIDNRSDSTSTALVFTLSEERQKNALASEGIKTELPFLIRLDTVTFPAGAIAYRHIHPGSGFRYLLKGGLHLEADDHSFDATAGTSWFEPANSPVRATASLEHEQTQFIRCMVLPPEFKGKPTINILSEEDKQKPKLQTTHRFIDEIVTEWP